MSGEKDIGNRVVNLEGMFEKGESVEIIGETTSVHGQKGKPATAGINVNIKTDKNVKVKS